jgi:branched-chain amino acid transport system ATP-binding protein
MLELKQISKNFGGLRALSNVNLTIHEGEVVGLIGPNGSGKSTAFNVITGVFPPTSGHVIFRGEDITRLPSFKVAKRGMARTFQLVRPFLHLSTLDNVVAGCWFSPNGPVTRRSAEARAMEILDQVGLADKAAKEAHGLTVIERKWLEVARALAGNPKLLLLDEFMAGLRSTEIPRALALITALNQSGITIVVVEHIVKAIFSTCHRVIVLNAGEMLADGTPQEIINNHLVIEAYLGTRHVDS